MLVAVFVLFLGYARQTDACSLGSTEWHYWGSCSSACGGGTRSRSGESCFWGISEGHQTESCNEICQYQHSYYGGSCHCPAWRAGRCCETCSHIYLANCKSGQQECGGYPDNIRCTECAKGYFSEGYGKGCSDIDECASSPCQNDANCTNGLNEYTCTCAPGWTGTTCTTDIDECASSPCQNGASCTNGLNEYTCTCAPGWTGTTCATDINECASNPCQNGASCANGENKYLCTCAPGWTGTSCNTDIDECDSNPCQNGALCANILNEYKCTCAPGWRGSTCTIDINECASNPCQNGASCINDENKYVCKCAPGWAGTTCNTDINECASTPCQNGGTCSDIVNSYSCACVDGYTGIDCETDINDCVSTPCLNGTCLDLVNSYNCTCDPGYDGTHCEINIDECDSAPCQNRGTCLDRVNSYSCACIDGFTGITCETDTKVCATIPCLNGTCLNDGNAYRCICYPGFTGNECEKDIDECASVPCQNAGTCSDRVNSYSCACMDGYTGNTCETDIDECASTPCLYGGFCSDLVNSYNCTCDDGYEGNDCETYIGTTTTCMCVCPTVESKCVTNMATSPLPTTGHSICSLPEKQKLVVDKYSCTFDHDLCEFSLDAYPHLWELKSHRYGDSHIGEIQSDHSQDQSGGYLVFNTNNNHVQAQMNHKFTSSTLTPNTTYCVSFWYNMPTNQSLLEVFIVPEDKSPKQLIWVARNMQTLGWIQTSLNVYGNTSFMLQFASRKDHIHGFLAVDDIRVFIGNGTNIEDFTSIGVKTDRSYDLKSLFKHFTKINKIVHRTNITEKSRTVRSIIDLHHIDVSNRVVETDDNLMSAAADPCNCSCPTVLDDCETTTAKTIKTRPVCGNITHAVLIRSLSCDFDNRNSCEYNFPFYPHLWELHRYRYGNDTVGVIEEDNSKDGDGGYVVFSSDNYHVDSAKTDTIISQTFQCNGIVCLQFSYNMPTSHSTLSVYQDVRGQHNLLWHETQSKTKGWKEESILVQANDTFQIVFSSMKTGLDSYVGVDNIRVYSHLQQHVQIIV